MTLLTPLTLLTWLRQRLRHVRPYWPGFLKFPIGLVPLQSGNWEQPQKSPLADFRRRMELPHWGQSGDGGFCFSRDSRRFVIRRSLKPPVFSKALPWASIWLLSIFRARLIIISMALATTTASSESSQQAYFFLCFRACLADSWTTSRLRNQPLADNYAAAGFSKVGVIE